MRLSRCHGALLASLALFACEAQGGTTSPEGGQGSGEPSTSAVAPVEAEPEAGAGDEGEAEGGAALSDAAERFTHESLILSLDPDTCLLTATQGEQRLEHRFEFPGPCHFNLADGLVRAIETDTGQALMVEGSKALEQGCDTALRAVVLTPEGPRVSRAVQRVMACTPGTWDAMMFHVLASEPVAFGTPGQDP